MKLGDLFGKKDVSTILQKSVPYKMTTSCFPYKLYANRKGSTMLTVSIENLTSEPLMSSIVIKLPSKLSFDQTGLSREKEIRLGDLKPREGKDARIDIFSDVGTERGDYTIDLMAIAHYRDYGHVINAIRKRIQVGVV